jgi:ABC-type branched-subunit amino acid transport system ATPase component
MTAVLSVEDLTVEYGGVRALDGVDLDVEEGAILGIIGPNGAGKTTLFECIAGFVDPTHGSVSFDGVQISGWGPERRGRAGLIRSFQDARLFASLTVFQTLLVAHEKAKPSRLVQCALSFSWVRRSEREKAERADELIRAIGLEPYRDKFVGELSTGTRRILELGCVLALDPRLLLLDEPSSGIAQREVEALGALLRRVKEMTGCTMLVIEHDMPLIMSLADRIFAMESGRRIAEGLPDEIAHNPDVVASYLGTTPQVIERSGKTRPARPTPKAKSSRSKTTRRSPKKEVN